MSSRHFRVLLTNDDGISAPGLGCAADALVRAGYDVKVVAPAKEQSGVGHAITITEPLHARSAEDGRELGLASKVGVPAAAVRGTPADCVKLATTSALLGSWRPQLVLSGINRGPNFGLCTIVSGTCAAARQAAWQGIPSIAVSLDCFLHDANFERAAESLLPVLGCVRDAVCSDAWDAPRTFVNVNLPDERDIPPYTDFLGRHHACGRHRGYRVVKLSTANVTDHYQPQPNADAGSPSPWQAWKLVGAQIDYPPAEGVPEEVRVLAEGFAVLSAISTCPGDSAEQRAALALRELQEEPGADSKKSKY